MKMLNEDGTINKADDLDLTLEFPPLRNLGEKFNKKLHFHKILLTEFNNTRNTKLIVPYISSGEVLTLIYAQFKCEKCFTEDNLQLHHLIPRKVQLFTDKGRYFTQRHYWANIIVLCNSCHAEFHQFDKSRFIKESLCISNQKINKLKELYKTNNMELNN